VLNATNLADQDLNVIVSAPGASDKHTYFGPSVATNLTLGVGGAEKLRITNAGYVGIGTTTPSGALDVNGDGFFRAGLFATPYVDAYGAGNGTAIYGFSDSTSAFTPTLYVENDDSTNAGDWVFEAVGPYFGGECTIDLTGNLFCTGVLGAAARVAGNQKVGLYTVQSSENWVEDFGSGKLSGGVATVELEPRFGQAVTAANYHVFLTPAGDCQGLYITNRTATSFEVHELQGGKSNVEFDYRIVAHRTGFEAARLPDLTSAFAGKVARPALPSAHQVEAAAKK